MWSFATNLFLGCTVATVIIAYPLYWCRQRKELPWGQAVRHPPPPWSPRVSQLPSYNLEPRLLPTTQTVDAVSRRPPEATNLVVYVCVHAVASVLYLHGTVTNMLTFLGHLRETTSVGNCILLFYQQLINQQKHFNSVHHNVRFGKFNLSSPTILKLTVCQLH